MPLFSSPWLPSWRAEPKGLSLSRAFFSRSCLCREGPNCLRNCFRCSAELTELQSLRDCLGWWARLLAACLSPASVSTSVATVPKSAAQRREDSPGKHAVWQLLFFAQMAGTLAESGPASQGRDALESSYPFPSNPEPPNLHDQMAAFGTSALSDVLSWAVWVGKNGEGGRNKGNEGEQRAESTEEGTGFGGGLLAQLNCFHPQNDS